MASMDEDGYLWYQGRADDMFKVAGYRVGPSEIENCIVKHPAVANAAVIPIPDETRGNVVKAFVVLAAGHAPSKALEDDIQQHVRKFLAPYEYPKEIEFIDALPMTTTGKVQRKVLREREAGAELGQQVSAVRSHDSRCLACRFARGPPEPPQGASPESNPDEKGAAPASRHPRPSRTRLSHDRHALHHPHVLVHEHVTVHHVAPRVSAGIACGT